MLFHALLFHLAFAVSYLNIESFLFLFNDCKIIHNIDIVQIL